jgi:hypothetical protein
MSLTAGERRIVSVLVADVVGSTSIADRLGPEGRSTFRRHRPVMREEVERFGGTVAQLTGDGLLALFGTPIAHEDDSERAVRAALAIRESLDEYRLTSGPLTDSRFVLESASTFHGDRAPDYGDFAHVAFTIGMTYPGLGHRSRLAADTDDRLTATLFCRICSASL